VPGNDVAAQIDNLAAERFQRAIRGDIAGGERRGEERARRLRREWRHENLDRG
jgi:hypothetical protein